MDEMDLYVGEIRLFPYLFIPQNWLCCDGAIYPAKDYDVLYHLIFNKYGGNPEQTFAVPDLMATQPHPAMRYCIATQGSWPGKN